LTAGREGYYEALSDASKASLKYQVCERTVVIPVAPQTLSHPREPRSYPLNYYPPSSLLFNSSYYLVAPTTNYHSTPQILLAPPYSGCSISRYPSVFPNNELIIK
jgi:hypothetical protein